MTTKTLSLVLFGLGALATAALLRPSDVGATPPSATAPAQPGSAPSAAPAATGEPPAAVPTTATIVFATSPPVTAMVTWGKKRLGKITPGKALVVVRPRDSGPLDVMVRATGYLPVQTRAHTFSDHRVLVKLTPLDKKSELLGYRAPLDAGVEPEIAAELNAVAGPDAGVAPVPGTFQMIPSAPPQSPLLAP
jgi:hypothetical protein